MHIQKKDVSSIPVIGFENESFNANKKREHSFSGGDSFQDVSTKARVFQHLSNAGKILGAFPFVTGQIVGVARIITTIKSDSSLYGDSKKQKAKHIIRGLSECFGIGALWLLLDVGATTTRFFSSLKKGEASPEEDESKPVAENPPLGELPKENSNKTDTDEKHPLDD